MADKITFQDNMHCAKLQQFCWFGSGIITLEIQCMPYLYRNDDKAG